MRILINDFGGYPFPVELSRYLAKNGYTILHCYISNIATPHGNMEKSGSDSDTLNFEPVILKTEFKKYSIIGRFKGEIQYAKCLSEKIDTFKPDIFLSANTPLIAQNLLLKKCLKKQIKFVYWCQDIHSIALAKFFDSKIPVFGFVFTKYFKSIEIRLLKKSNHVINIAESFTEIFKDWGLDEKHMTTIHNWGPFSEIKLMPKSNDWSKKLGVESKLVVLYSGTLGLKHNPLLIVESAKHFQSDPNIMFIVISEGIGADIIKEQKTALGLDNVLVLEYQDYELLSQVLGSADILLSVLEEHAALFSVPSKVLTYLCSQKAILLSVPKDNLSAKIITENNAGFCVEPSDKDGFISKMGELIADKSLREKLAKNGRKYAEENFEISGIAKKFMKVFKSI